MDKAPKPLQGQCELVVQADDARAVGSTRMPLAVRVVVTSAGGKHPDGSGRGVYADGRFFADGEFIVRVPAGRTSIAVRGGPNYVPLTIGLDAQANSRMHLRVYLYRWFAPEERGWYGGDSHVHTQHDPTAYIKTDDHYTALQGRAQGLSYISQATKRSRPVDPATLRTPTFLYRTAAEVGVGAFIGHLTTPGIRQPLGGGKFSQAFHQPLSVQKIVEAAHDLGGIVTYTHPMGPPHQLHWMGATEAYSDAVLGRCADAFDMESRRTEPLYFAMLNLGNKLAVSGYTDCALERKGTLSPGDRPVYSHASRFDFDEIIQAIAYGRTFATNGGPVFPFLTIDGHEPGDTLSAKQGLSRRARLEVHSLYPLKSAELHRRGARVVAFDVGGRHGEVVLTHAIAPEVDGGWWLARVEDDRGNWAITSPIYFRGEPAQPRSFSYALLLEIGNTAPMVELRRQFFAHVIATVSPTDPMKEVRLVKDGRSFKSSRVGAADHMPKGQVPVTGGAMEYEEGWQWFPAPTKGVHFQADWPVAESGWYSLEATTASGRTPRSDAVHFDAANPNSSEICVARLSGPDTRVDRAGYGEEMPLAEIKLPFEGDHWWYPEKTFWQLRGTFGQDTRELTEGDASNRARFRPQAAAGP
ncbi:MAG: CehA/McbA family metallohydrolase [Isosphaeraceae bacterium]